MSDDRDLTPSKPAEIRFSDLSPKVQRFFRDMRDEDVGLLQEAMKLVRSLLTVGRFFKWLVVTVVGFFIGAAMLGDAIVKLAKWVRPPQ